MNFFVSDLQICTDKQVLANKGASLFLLLCCSCYGSCGCCCHHGGCGHFCHGCVDAHESSLLSLFHFISIKLKNASLKDGWTEGW